MSANLPTVRQSTGLTLQAEGPSIMAEKPVSLSTSGSVRPGIMRLVRAHADKSGVREAYESGMDAGLSWKAIETNVRRAAGLDDKAPSPLTPQNTHISSCAVAIIRCPRSPTRSWISTARTAARADNCTACR